MKKTLGLAPLVCVEWTKRCFFIFLIDFLDYASFVMLLCI